MSNPAEQMKSIEQQMGALRASYLEQAKILMRDGAQQLFDDNPELESFSWTQYTDFFNDGDTCHFGVHTTDEQMWVNGYRTEDMIEWTHPIDAPTNQYGSVDWKHYVQVQTEHYYLLPLLYKAEEFMRQFSEDSLLFMFGDHSKITVAREGVDIDEYTDHD